LYNNSAHDEDYGEGDTGDTTARTMAEGLARRLYRLAMIYYDRCDSGVDSE